MGKLPREAYKSRSNDQKKLVISTGLFGLQVKNDLFFIKSVGQMRFPIRLEIFIFTDRCV